VLAAVIVVYDLADGTTRTLLWLGFVLGCAISIATVAYLLPQIQQAISQATSGSTLDPGPINSLETTATVLGIAKIVPDLLFAWAYLRARDAASDREPGSDAVPI